MLRSVLRCVKVCAQGVKVCAKVCLRCDESFKVCVKVYCKM